jgi:hypothetical protein
MPARTSCLLSDGLRDIFSRRALLINSCPLDGSARFFRSRRPPWHALDPPYDLWERADRGSDSKMRRCFSCGRMIVWRSKLSSQLCSPCAEGERGVASALDAEPAVRRRLYGRAGRSAQVERIPPASSPEAPGSTA